MIMFEVTMCFGTCSYRMFTMHEWHSSMVISSFFLERNGCVECLGSHLKLPSNRKSFFSWFAPCSYEENIRLMQGNANIISHFFLFRCRVLAESCSAIFLIVAHFQAHATIMCLLILFILPTDSNVRALLFFRLPLSDFYSFTSHSIPFSSSFNQSDLYRQNARQKLAAKLQSQSVVKCLKCLQIIGK